MGKYKIKFLISASALFAIAILYVTFSNIMPTKAIEIGTELSISNVPPLFTSGPSDNGSSAFTPTNAGNNVTFTSTAHDSNGDQYYLAICKTDSITPNNNAAPTCTDGYWAISGAINSDSETTITYSTSTGDAESNDWYAFVCDKNSPGMCSPSSQGTGINGSPFNVNHRPAIGNVKIGQECGTTTEVPPGNSTEMKITNGILSDDDQAHATALQSDGKIVSVGYSFNGTDNDFSIVRYDTDGTMDANFSVDGKTTASIGSGDDRATSVAIQYDNKIVVAGYSWNGSNYDFAVTRYNYNGTPDTTFGTDGIVTTAIGSGDDKANAIAVFANGKIVVAGYSYNAGNDDFTVVRYNTNGTLDTTFDSDGIVTTSIGSGDSAVNSLALQPDGKIVAAGYSWDGSHNNFALSRYYYNGAPDTAGFGTLGTGGIVTTAVGLGDSAINSIDLQSDGKIAAAGYSSNGSNDDFTLVRYNTNGTLDNTANSGSGSGITPHGTVTTPYPQQADILLSENGGYITWYLLYSPEGKQMIAVQKIDANGGPLWGDGIVVNDDWVSGSHGSVWLSTDGNGGAFITWTDETLVHTQRVNSSGTTVFPSPVAADISASCGGGTPDTPWMGPGSYGWEGNFPWNKFVSYDGEGGILMFWDVGFYGTNLCAQKIDANGNRKWTDNGVIMPRGDGWLMSLASDGNGGGFFASGIMIESHIWHIDVNGNFVSGCNNTSLNSQNIIDLTYDGAGNVVVLFNGGFAGSPVEDAQIVTANSYGQDCSHNSNWPTNGVTVSTNLKPWFTNIETQVFGDKMMISWIDSEPTDTYATLINSSDGSNVWGGTKTVASQYDPDHNFTWSYAVPSGSDYLFFSVKSINSADPTGDAILSKLSGSTGNPVPAFGGELSIGSSYIPITVGPDGENGLVIIYQVTGNSQLFSQRYNSDGAEIWASLNSVVVSAPVVSGSSVLSTNGYVVTPIGTYDDRANSIAVQTDGKIVVAGYSNNGSNNDFALVRYNTDGSLDTSFDSDAIVTTSLGSGNDYAYSINLQSDEMIVATGYSDNGTDDDFALVRYNTDGSIDSPADFACVQTEITDSDSDTALDTIDMHVCSTNSFSNGACTASTLCEITGVLTGGQAECLMRGEVPIPDAHGIYNVYVFLTDNNNLTDLGVNNEQSYAVADVPPVLTYYSATDAPAPSAGGSDTVNFSVSLTDDNGDNDVTNVSGVFFDKAVAANDCSAAENSCYPTPSCSLTSLSTPGLGKTALGTDNSLGANCSVTVWYNANASNWDVEAKATDGNGVSSFSNADVNLTNPSLLGIEVVEASISYGSVVIGGTSSSQPTTMANMGNQVIDILIDGDAMCTSNCDDTIPTGQQKWSTFSSFDWDAEEEASSLVTAASSSSGCYGADIGVRADHTINSTDKSIYWKLRIPNSQKAGSYTGQNTFTSTIGGTCSGTAPSPTYEVTGNTGEGSTISLSCNGTDPIDSYVSKFGIGTACGSGEGVDCGTCTIGSSSCDITYSSATCGGDCAPGESKDGDLTLTCLGTPPENSYDISATGGETDTISLSCNNADPITSFISKWGVGCSECGGGEGVDCGTCTIGSDSCSVSYNSGLCGGDCHSGCYKPSSLTITCSGTPPACGNGSIEIGETCDDGNTANGDGCSSTCQSEALELYVNYDTGTANQICSASQPCDSINTAVGSSFFATIAGLTTNEIPIYVRGTKMSPENISNNAYANAVLLQPWSGSHPVIKNYFTFYRANVTLDGFEIDGSSLGGGPPGAIFASGASNAIIRNSYIHNYPGTGIFLNSSSDAQVYNNIFADNKPGSNNYCGGILISGSSGIIATNNTVYEGCNTNQTSYSDISVMNGATNTILKQNIVYNSLGGSTYRFDGGSGVNSVNGISLSGALYTDQTGIDFVGGDNYIAATDPFTDAASAISWSTAGTGFVLTTPASYSITTPAAETQSTDYLGHQRPNGTATEVGAIENVELELYVDYSTGTNNPACSVSQPCDSINTAVGSSAFGTIAGLTSNEISIYVKGTKMGNENIGSNAYSNPVLLQPWGASHPIIKNYFTFSRSNVTLDGFEIDGSSLGGGPPGALYITNTSNPVIKNSYIHNYPGTGIYLAGTPNAQIYNNIFANNKTSNDSYCGGIYSASAANVYFINNSLYQNCTSGHTGNQDVMIRYGTTTATVKQNIVYNNLGGTTYIFDGLSGVSTVNGVSVTGTAYTGQTGIDYVGGSNYIAATDPFTDAGGVTSWSTAGTGFALSVPGDYIVTSSDAGTPSTDYLGNTRPNGAGEESGAIED